MLFDRTTPNKMSKPHRVSSPTASEQQPVIRTELVGREHSTKSSAVTVFPYGPLREAPPSGLQLATPDTKKFNALVRNTEATLNDLNRAGLPSTIKVEQHTYHLFDAEECCAILQLRDVVGQVFSHATPDSPPEELDTFDAYVRYSVEAHVHFIMLPYPYRDDPAEYQRLARDQQLYETTLRSVLQQRRPDWPLAVALVVNRLDAAFPSETEAQAKLTDEVLQEMLGPLVNLLTRSKKVGAAAIFPTTFFGFGNAVVQAPTGQASAKPAAGSSPHSRGEPDFTLKPGALPRPYNLTPLVWWSLLTGLMLQDMRGKDAQVSDLEDVTNRLRADLEWMNAWYIPLPVRG
jgi:hypothetical protein